MAGGPWISKPRRLKPKSDSEFNAKLPTLNLPPHLRGALILHLCTDRPLSRHTVYRMNINSGKEPMLDAFDCPDPSVKTPRRGVTITPLQALSLMNNSFVQRQAEQLADRAMKGAPDDLPKAVQAAYRLALSRSPTPVEMERALGVSKERSLASVCWALLNSTEFVYLR